MMRDSSDLSQRTRLDGALRRDSVKKNVAAIHVSGKLTLLQRKLSNVLLLNAYDHLAARQRHRIDARTLCLMIGYNSNDLDTLKAALRSLAETVCEWDLLAEDGAQEWGVSSLLSFAKLKGGICEYGYSPVLADKLNDPKIFALINLDIQRRFTSGHGLALYENCYRFVRTGSTGWWEIDLFRRLMGVDDSEYYRSFKHLNAKIIKPAVAEVNRSSNIVVTPEFRKMGRSVASLRFRIRENPQLAMFQIDDSDGVRTSETYAALVGQGVSDRLARQWIAEHGAAYVQEKLAYVSQRRGAGKVKNPSGYLWAAIAGNYRDGSAAAEPPAAADPAADARARAAVERKRIEAAEDKAADDARTAARARRVAKLRRILEAVEGFNATRRDADRRAFLARLDRDIERADFQRYGWRSALCFSAIASFWEQREPEIFADLETALDAPEH
jgi:hypothetical protein